MEHFPEVFQATYKEAALSAGIFNRKKVPIDEIKDHLKESKFKTR
jgi:imidazole glycerol phosphate synthase subunit HisF